MYSFNLIDRFLIRAITISLRSTYLMSNNKAYFQVMRPYVVIEIDDPGQRMQTLNAEMSDSQWDAPKWDQEFTL